MRKLSLREKIGQLIVTGFAEPNMTGDLRRLISDYKIGNLILFSHNVENKKQLGSLCAELHRFVREQTGIPALISIDQEGGRVTRLPADAANVPGAMAIASTGRPENAYAAGRITARELRALGIRFNLAPVLDINNNPRNPVINVRSYGETAETVEQYGLPMLQGLMDGGVLASVKHFPGHGDTAVDSHLGLPAIHKSLEELSELELRPFVQAFRQGAECVTIAHILFPALEPEKVPATMSRAIVTDLLKRKLEYNGLVISDCLEMDAIRRFYGTAEGALGALKAGIHLLFVSHTPALVAETSERIEKAVRDGELPMPVIDEAVEKVLYYKRKYGGENEEHGTGPAKGSEDALEAVGGAVHRRAAQAISLESVCLVRGELPRIVPESGDTLFVGCLPNRPDQASSRVKAAPSFADSLGEALAAPHLTIAIDPSDEEIGRTLEIASRYSNVVLGLFNGLDHPGQIRLANRLAAVGCRVTAIALGKPYDLASLEGAACELAVFEYTALSLASLATILRGEAEPTGRIGIGSLADRMDGIRREPTEGREAN
ncbi:glycoside hydrolase family 3 [Cohnella sp. CBP 2801]|uniref:Glycoside hydrolase family 3 n=1 Tax=Cohnella zeiphila TaxID=2761120 RepID=A0A7X0SI70_9BACL|nr:glycoside hydrolase family 3 [Cohnella zeiphila]